MWKFLKYIICVGIGTLALLWLLDLGYTAVYSRTKTRTPYQLLRSQKGVAYNFVFIGSSRVFYHVNPVQIEEATGLRGINFTRPGCGSDEMLLLTRLFFANGNTADRMFFQVDASWEQLAPDTKSMASAMPYLKEPLFADHYKEWSEFSVYRYFPFYRYARFSPEIGYREIAMASLGDDGASAAKKGFGPLDSRFRGTRILNMELKSESNPKLEEVVALCRANHCEPQFFTAPFFDFKGADFGVFLRSKLPNYRDFSRSLRDEADFRDASHMNVVGAKKFTNIIIQEWFTQ
jgi:hypothetical protein